MERRDFHRCRLQAQPGDEGAVSSCQFGGEWSTSLVMDVFLQLSERWKTHCEWMELYTSESIKQIERNQKTVLPKTPMKRKKGAKKPPVLGAATPLVCRLRSRNRPKETLSQECPKRPCTRQAWRPVETDVMETQDGRRDSQRGPEDEAQATHLSTETVEQQQQNAMCVTPPSSMVPSDQNETPVVEPKTQQRLHFSSIENTPPETTEYQPATPVVLTASTMPETSELQPAPPVSPVADTLPETSESQAASTVSPAASTLPEVTEYQSVIHTAQQQEDTADTALSPLQSSHSCTEHQSGTPSLQLQQALQKEHQSVMVVKLQDSAVHPTPPSLLSQALALPEQTECPSVSPVKQQEDTVDSPTVSTTPEKSGYQFATAVETQINETPETTSPNSPASSSSPMPNEHESVTPVQQQQVSIVDATPTTSQALPVIPEKSEYQAVTPMELEQTVNTPPSPYTPCILLPGTGTREDPPASSTPDLHSCLSAVMKLPAEDTSSCVFSAVKKTPGRDLTAVKTGTATKNVVTDVKSFLQRNTPTREQQEQKLDKLKEAVAQKKRKISERQRELRAKRMKLNEEKKKKREEKTRQVQERRVAMAKAKEKKTRQLMADKGTQMAEICEKMRSGREEQAKKLTDSKTSTLLDMLRQEAEKNRPKLREIFTQLNLGSVTSTTAAPMPADDGQQSQLKRETFTLQRPALTEAIPSTPCGGVKEVAEVMSYKMTPIDLDDSDDDIDEHHPKRRIPAWARSSSVQFAVSQQYQQGASADRIFSPSGLASCDLSKIFERARPRYHTRTSSAVWAHSPAAALRKN